MPKDKCVRISADWTTSSINKVKHLKGCIFSSSLSVKNIYLGTNSKKLKLSNLYIQNNLRHYVNLLIHL